MDVNNINYSKYLEAYIDRKIESKIRLIQNLVCKVISFDGIYASVEIAALNKTTQNILKNVPVVSSYWSRPIVQKDDVGLLINLNNEIFNFLEEKENNFYCQASTYVFLPLISKSQKLAENGNSEIKHSPDRLNRIVFSNNGINETLKQQTSSLKEGLTITNEGATSISTSGNTSISTSGNTSISTSGNTSVTSDGDSTLSGSNVNISGDSACNISASTVAITGATSISSSTPVSVTAAGESSSLGSLLSEFAEAICTGIDDAHNGSVVNHAFKPNESVPGDIAAIQAIIARLRSILG